jgi:hypothetical protein
LALVARSTPDAIIPLLIDKVERGEHPTVAEIKEEIAAHRRTLKGPPKTSPASEPPKVIKDADPLARAIDAVKALSDEDRAEFCRWFGKTYPGTHGREAVAEDIADSDPIESPATSLIGAATFSPRMVGADALPREGARMEPASPADCNNRDGRCHYLKPCVGQCAVRPRSPPASSNAAREAREPTP